MRYLYFILIILVLGCIAGAIITSGIPILYFVNFISLMVVLLPSAFLALISYSFGEIGLAFTSAFKKITSTKINLKNALLFFNSLQAYILLSAGLATLIGFVAILYGSPDKNNMIASGIAVSLESILYALLLILVCIIPFKTGIKKKLNDLDKEELIQTN